jgi:hypothetical protein
VKRAWYILGAAGFVGGLLLIRRDAEHEYRSPVREGVLGGLLAGAGLAVLALLQAPERLRPPLRVPAGRPSAISPEPAPSR